jgi:hypothetical protein
VAAGCKHDANKDGCNSKGQFHNFSQAIHTIPPLPIKALEAPESPQLK